MGEAAESYWLEKFIDVSLKGADEEIAYFSAAPEGETDDDWKFGSD